jgi:hypothetical protein
MDLEKKFTYKSKIDYNNSNHNHSLRKRINENEIKGFYRNENYITRKGIITEKELIIYSRNKIIKDADFAKNTVPYIRGYVLFVGSIFFIGSFIWSRYYKKSNMSFSKMMLLNFADLEEEEN